MKRALALLVLLGLLGIALHQGARALPEFVVQNRWFVEGRTTLQELRRDLEDARVAAGVRTALVLNRSLKPFELEVFSQDSSVLLRGEVASEELKAGAGRVAEVAPGVREVRNELVIKAALLGGDPEGRGLGRALRDRAIEVQTRLAFSLNRELEGSDLKVHAAGGRLTVAGAVDSAAQGRVALEVAREIPDVDEVVDGTRLRAEAGSPAAADAPRAVIAERSLAANPHLAPYGLRVRQVGDRLVLEGSVRTAIERDLAVLISEREGGGAVESALELRP